MNRSEDESTKTSSLVELSDVLKNITSAVIIAKDFMDETSSEKAKKYSKHELLSLLPLPFFTIADITLQLKFAISGTGEQGQVYVSIDTASLEKLPSYIISQIEVKLNPHQLKAYKTEEGTFVHASTT